MTDGHGQRVGGVVGGGDLGEVKLEPDHLLHLLLAAGPVAGDALLDLGGAVFTGGDTADSGCQQGDGLGAADCQCGLHVPGDEGVLDGHAIRVVAIDYLQEFFIYKTQPLRYGVFLVAGKSAELDQGHAVIAALDYSVAHDQCARVDA